MKTIFKILLFLILFNIASALIAYIGIFPNTLYGNTDDLIDPTNIDDVETYFQSLWNDPLTGSSPSITIGSYDVVVFSFGVLTAGILGLAILIGVVTKSTPSVLSAGLVCIIFLLMYKNSKQGIESILKNLDSSASYLVLMFGVAFLFIVLITIMDYLSGQQSAGG